MNRYKLFGTVSVAILMTVLAVSTSYLWEGQSTPQNGWNNYMDEQQLAAVNSTYTGVFVSGQNSTIFVNGSTDLTVMMGPMNAPSMYSFEILGIINPTLLVKEGSTINFTAVNVDTDSYHNFVLSREGPPYYSMGNMMQGVGFMSPMNYLPPVHSNSFAYQNLSYVFTNSGTYWYLCTYPGHASNGMYGKILVS